jgi:GT2 family glycosyltransferase
MPNKEGYARLAVLMTCHNRVAGTIACLTSLKNQKPFGASLELIVTDDGSSDGTASAIGNIFPDATIIQGDGNLFWCGGMRAAFAHAMQSDYDFYLWLNDDTRLNEDALPRILQTYSDASSQLGSELIIVGSTCDPESGTMSYGGWKRRTGNMFSTSWEKIPPQMNRWTTCDTMNGNCALIPRSVAERMGNLDVNFSHSMGDLDYGLRAKEAGCQIVIVPGYCGICGANNGTGMWTDKRLPLRVRWNKLLGPKGLPIKEWMVFTRRHKGPLWILVWLSPYARFWLNALPQLMGLK